MKVFKVLLVALLFLSFFTVNGYLAANKEKDEKKENEKNYLVVLKKQVDKETFIEKKKLKDRKLKDKKIKKFKHINSFVVTLSESEVSELESDSDIKILEEDALVTITETSQAAPEQTIPWGISAIGSTEGFKKDAFGQAVKVAILDTGVSNHQDLKVEGGTSFVNDLTSYTDDNGHGTHVAGTIAALNNQVGVVGLLLPSNFTQLKS